MADNGKKTNASDDWMKALEELEDFDRRREARKSITPRPVKETPSPRPTEPVIVSRPPEVDDGRGDVYEIILDPESGSVTSNPPADPARVVVESEGAAKAPRAQPTPTPTPSSPALPNQGDAMRRYDELRRKKTVTVKSDDLAVMEEMSEVICTVNTAASKLEKFREVYGDALPEDKLNIWKSNLRDASMVMLKEFYSLRNGKQAKVYDKKNICVKCHGVFMEALPPDRICDECRSSMVPRGAKGS